MKLEELLQYLLPKELFEFFDLKEIEELPNNSLRIFLDEKAIIPTELSDRALVSHGFDEPVVIQDFPIRDKAVFLIVRRRRWKENGTKTIYSNKWNLTAQGTSYTKEFAEFLKKILR